MPRHFEQGGISFSYPDGWSLEQEEAESGWTVALYGPGTVFLTLTCDENLPDQQDMAEAALEALRSDYPDLDAVERVESIAGQTAYGHDIEFISFDLTNTCWTRSFYSAAGTILVLGQYNDLEAESAGPALQAIRASIRVDEDE